MNALLHLSRIALIPVITDWVEVVDLCILDTSVCNQAERPFLHSLLLSESFTHNGSKLNMKDAYFVWLNDRRIKVRHLNLTNCNQQNLSKVLMSLLQRQKSIKYLQVYHCSSLNTILSACVVESLNLSGSTDMLDEDLLTVLKKCNSLRGLDITDCENITDVSALKIAKLCPSLQSMSFAGCDTTPKLISSLARHCGAELRELHTNTSVNDECLLKLSEHCPNLRTLHLQDCPGVTDQSVVALAESAPHLGSLSLSGCSVSDLSIARIAECCTQLTELSIDNCMYIGDEALLAAAAHCPSLKTLEVFGNHNITDASMRRIAENCVHLQKVVLSNCSAITDVTLVYMARHCRRLEEVDVSECVQVSDYVVNLLFDRCPMLNGVCLYSTSCSDASLLHLAQSVDSLILSGKSGEHTDGDYSSDDESSRSSQQTSDSDSDIDSLLGDDDPDLGSDGEDSEDEEEDDEGEGTLFDKLFGGGTGTAGAHSDSESDDDYEGDGAGPLNTTLDVIKRQEVVDRVQGDHLSLQITRPTPRLPTLAVVHRHGEIKEATFGTLTTCSPDLKELRVSHYRRSLTDSVMTGLIDAWGHSLHTVSLKTCTLLTSMSFSLIAKQCVGLRSLEITGSKTLTDEALGRVLAACGGALKHLNVERCPALSNESLVRLGACTQLEALNLSCSPLLNDDCLHYIVSGCPVLRLLDISGCHKLTTKCLHGLSNLASLRYLDIRYCDGLASTAALESKFIGKMKKNDKMVVKH